MHNSYLTVIGVHEMHGRVHHNYSPITILLVVDLIGLLYNDLTPSHSRQIAYKNFGCYRQLLTSCNACQKLIRHNAVHVYSRSSK